MKSNPTVPTGYCEEELQSCLEEIKTEEIKPIAHVFSLNVKSAMVLGAMPLTLLYLGKLEMARIGFFAPALVSIKNGREYLKSEAARLEVQDYINQKVEENETVLMAEAKEILNRMGSHDGQMKNALLILDYAVLTSCWTAFESMAKDSWVTTLNKYPMELGKAAFECPGGRDEDPFKDKKNSN